MQPTLPIQISQAKIAKLCQQHYIRKLSLGHVLNVLLVYFVRE